MSLGWVLLILTVLHPPKGCWVPVCSDTGYADSISWELKYKLTQRGKFVSVVLIPKFRVGTILRFLLREYFTFLCIFFLCRFS